MDSIIPALMWTTGICGIVWYIFRKKTPASKPNLVVISATAEAITKAGPSEEPMKVSVTASLTIALPPGKASLEEMGVTDEQILEKSLASALGRVIVTMTYKQVGDNPSFPGKVETILCRAGSPLSRVGLAREDITVEVQTVSLPQGYGDSLAKRATAPVDMATAIIDGPDTLDQIEEARMNAFMLQTGMNLKQAQAYFLKYPTEHRAFKQECFRLNAEARALRTPADGGSSQRGKGSRRGKAPEDMSLHELEARARNRKGKGDNY